VKDVNAHFAFFCWSRKRSRRGRDQPRLRSILLDVKESRRERTSAGFKIWKEHSIVSSTLIIAPALSNSPQLGTKVKDRSQFRRRDSSVKVERWGY